MGGVVWGAWGVVLGRGVSFVGVGSHLGAGGVVWGPGGSLSLKRVGWLMCERSGSFVGIANDPVWGADARGWWGCRFVLVFVFGFVFVVVTGPWALLLCVLLVLSALLVLSIVVVMGVVVGVAVVVVVVVVVVVFVVVVVVVGVGVGSGGGGRSNGDGCDMSHMINKHRLHKQTTGIPLHSVPVHSTEHSGLNSRMPKFRRNDQAPE